MNAQHRNKDLKVKNFQGAVFKGTFTICKVTNNLINLKNDKKISGKELRFQLFDVISIWTESLTFLAIENLKKDNIRRQYLSKTFTTKAALSY